jgi:hypothetical protein
VGGPSFRSTLKRSTVPVEFRFELAARLETTAKEKPGPGREAGNSRKRPRNGVDASSSREDDQTGSHASAWKGKACSRSNNSAATSMGRSKGRTPLIVPGAFRFSTEQRARDREKFEEGVRAKQREKAQQLEEDRAANAAEEEREMREMRKRTVPKAHAVPEWYATMPKRKAG